MKRILFLLLCSAASVLGQTSSVQVNSAGNVIGPPIVNFATGGLKVNGVNVGGGGGGGTGTVTSITATAPVIVTPSPLTATGVISINTAAFEVPLTFSQSLARAINTVTLLNDSATPGNSKYYGTDSGGTKGWFTLPAGGGVTSVFTRTGAVVAASGDYSIGQITGANATNWDTAFTDRMKWDGGATGLVAGTGRTSLGGTTVGQNFFTLTNPSAITFPKIDAANAVTAENAATHRTSIGLGNVENTALSTWTGSTSLTTLGTIGTGTWNATAIATGKGGLPVGGTTGQALTKINATDYNTQWTTLGGGSGTVTSITATAPIVVTPTPLTSTGVISVTGAALTKTDDTNVTLTLGGTPATSLLAATSITAGWTGTLSIARGGTGAATVAAGTVFANNTASTAAPAFVTNPRITAIANLTSDGFVKTSGGIGTLSVDTATYQPADADLTTWAGITPATGIGTWLATPSSANLRAAVTDENGTGALLFNGATTPDFTTGITIGAAAASRKMLVGDGTKFAPSTETWAVPGTSGNVLTSNGTNWTSAAPSAGSFSSLTGNWTLAQGPSTTASTLLGRTSASAGIPQEITLGSGLSMSGTTLNASGVVGGAPIVYLQTTAISPATTTSTSGLMAGLGGGASPAVITPVGTGKVFVTITGSAANDTASDGVNAQIYYGTGTAPANGAAPTGTAIGSIAQRVTAWGANQRTPFSLSAVISGLTPGTPIWIDLLQAAAIGGIASLQQVTVAAYEMPSGTVSDTVFGAGWNGVVDTAPSKNAVYDQMITYEPGLGNPGTNGYVLSSTTAGVRSWIAPGGGGGTPGGSNTQIQFNDSSAFGGDSTFTINKTTHDVNVAGRVVLNSLHAINDYSGALLIQSNGWTLFTNAGIHFAITGTGFVGDNAQYFGWQSTGPPVGGVTDTALARNAAGVVEVNNGTAGTYRDLITRTTRVNALTVATLPASPTLGQVASVSDGTASLAWGATVTGGASTKYLVWYNGTAWTVIGK